MERQAYLTNNECYKAAKKLTEFKGVMVHSTATPGVSADKFSKSWNVSKPNGREVCVHAFVDNKEIVNTLPYNYRAWGCGSGKKGSGNSLYVQIEMCEPREVYFENGWEYKTDNKEVVEEYIKQTVNNLVEFIADRLIEKGIYDVNKETVISHYEAYEKGIASNHSDPKGLLNLANLNMDTIRSLVALKIREKVLDQVGKEEQALNKKEESKYTKIKVICDSLNIREKPGTAYRVVGKITDNGVYTIVEKQGNWGRLKSGAGWINISKEYVKEV